MESSPKMKSPSFRILSRSNSEICAKFIRSSIFKSFSLNGKSSVCPLSPINKLKTTYTEKNDTNSQEIASNPVSAPSGNQIVLNISSSEQNISDIPRKFIIQTFSSDIRPMCRICHGRSGLIEIADTASNSVNMVSNSCSQSPVPKNNLHPESRSDTYSPTAQSIISSDTFEGSGNSESRSRLGQLIAPCLCDGSLKYVHEVCIQRWITVSKSNKCELCQFPFEIETYTKNILEWDYLPLSKMERRRIICSVFFHILTLICVIWSVIVLTERLIDDVENQIIGWPFWIKLIVIATGLAGGFIFSYMQWRMYIRLLVRLRVHNRMIVVQLPPEEYIKTAKSQRMSTNSVGYASVEAVESANPE